MHLLQHRLASLRRRARLLITARAVAALLAITVGSTTIVGLIDFKLHLPSLVRAYALVGILTSAAWIAYRWFIVPFAGRNDDLSLAIRLEEAYPELNDVLASTVQFLEAEQPTGSPAMRAKAIDRAMDLTAGLDFGRILDRAGLAWCTLAMTAALGLGSYLAWAYQDYAEIALRRLFAPFGNTTWTRINLDPVPPTRVAIGQPFPLRGQVEGIVPAQLRIDVEMLNAAESKHTKEPVFERRAEKTVALKPDATTRTASFATALDMTQLKGRFRFRIRGNDGHFPTDQPWQEVEVVPPPVFVDLDGKPSPQLTLVPPEYTGLPSPQPLSPGTRNVEIYLGTQIFLRAAVDRPLSAAWIDLEPLDPATRLGPLAAIVARPLLLNAAGPLAAHRALAGRFVAELDRSRRVLSAAFQPWASGNYVLHLEDADGLPKDYRAEVRVKLDPVPFVQIQQPSSSRSVLPDATIAFRILAEDEEFAVRSVALRYHRVDSNDQPLDATTFTPLYDPTRLQEAFAKTRPSLLPLPWTLPDMKARPKRLELAHTWALQGKYNEGDVLVVEAVADDFCNVVSPRQVGRSPSIKIRIVGKSDLAKILDDGLGDAQRELVRLQKMQQDAIDLVQGIDKAVDTQHKNDRLIEADQIQKQIQERIGNRPDEGLRGDLAKLDQLIKDNKLPPTDINDQVKELLSDLNRLSQEELARIEQALTEARKELTGTPKSAPKKQDGLNKTKQAQQKAKDALDEMVSRLDKFADVSQFKSDLRELIQEQQRIGKETEAVRTQLQKRGAADQNQPPPKPADEIAELLRAQADSEKQLADKTEKLQKRMKESLGRQDKGGQEFKTLAKKLAKSQTIEDDKERAAKVRELAQEARDLAKEQEGDAKTTLEQFAKNLDHAAEQIEKGKMSDEAQSEFQRQAQKALRQAASEATPSQVKNLKDAVKIGEEADIAGQMRKATKGISKELETRKEAPNLDQVRDVQEQALKNLQQQLAALEGQNDDGLDRLRKKQRAAAKAEDNIERLANKAKEAKNLKNPDEKADEQRHIAREARDQARELQRLQEERAAKELQRAAQALEDAADKTNANQAKEAEELEQEAERHFREAQKRIEELEEELAREQLAKIADRLQGLKQRQDTAIERTNELQQKLQKTRSWSRGLQQALEGDHVSQVGLAEEARSLQEKIQNARVFEHVIDKAAKAMERAADAMRERKKASTTRPPAWNDADWKDEVARHEAIVRLQTQASERLQRLLDALKEEPQAAAQQPPPQPMDGDGNMPRSRPPDDGIPPLAELKALRAEQLEINERTKDFAARHPNVDHLTEDQRRELTELEADQRRLREIFAGMTNKKGERP
ncbi:MAG: hypothetical protein NZO58_06395 [Gemmataceae bacterium]|nr:hypothetical protein [Gemmataceae bacterium]